MPERKIKKKIIPQMFDVRPVDEAGNLDLERIGRVRPVMKIGSNAPGKEKAVIRPQRSARLVNDVSLPVFDHAKAEADRFRNFIEEEKRSSTSELFRKYSVPESFEYAPRKTAPNPTPQKEYYFQEDEDYLIEERLSGFDSSRMNPIEDDYFGNQPKATANDFYENRLSFEKPTRHERTPVDMSGVYASLLVPVRLFKAVLALSLGFVQAVSLGISGTFKVLRRVLSGMKRMILGTAEGVSDMTGSIFAPPAYSYAFSKYSPKQHLGVFSAASFVILIAIFGMNLFSRGMKIKSMAMNDGNIAYANLIQAKDGMKDRDFNAASLKFDEAYGHFSEISNDVNSLGAVIIESSRFIPFLSKLSTGAHLAAAGKDISKIGSLTTDLLDSLNGIKNPLNSDDSVSYLDMFNESNKKVEEISSSMKDLESNLDKVNLDDIPEAQRSKFTELKKKLPDINSFLASYNQESRIFADILGGNGPRKYLFLFQNNQEMRATGGFIGTYATLDIFNGHIKKFFVDGIFNPDGQLREKIIPPAPIQKISAAWSLHDSNWFPDFPKSAEKAAWFYEKTGGPTVDGVITMTPTVMQRLLEITGPIEMPDYGVTVDKDNFLETIQQEVEVDYDKDLNQPKKILADLAPKILDRIFNARNVSDITKTMNILVDSLNEKHILIYSRNYDIEKILSDNGWSGEILDTDKDYLSVINTNINGYKTDGVVDQKIEHEAEIQDDGSIVDKVTITRHHNGGDAEYEWWNKVNADYMRVYVPKGSKLISVSGQTREFDSPPVDYAALGFKKDSQLQMEEDSTTIDEESGTRISEDSGKTVFGNWVYVSPRETAAITYSYLLPFKIDTNLTTKPADTYSLLVQKQSGSVKSDFSSKIVYPDFYENIWKFPEQNSDSLSELPQGKAGLENKSDLSLDNFIGMAFRKKNDSGSGNIMDIKNVFK
ncbi:MAG: DUF4012 domain-containing protein [Candidatus Moranbacteria bacterium]|nr:DUF4012 domain-containing protein [Candidatus Moranbacteria bacterium]